METANNALAFFNNNIIVNIILAILGLDTIRAIIAMTGAVKPDSKIAWLVYGRYKSSLIAAGLKELGFESQKSEELSKATRALVKQAQESYGITKDNAAEKLICLIAKYIVRFDKPIQYGGRKPTNSSYYIDTMEMVHDPDDLRDMTAIMTHLYTSQGKPKIPEVIVTPKGGNPLFAQSVASFYRADCLVAKNKLDKSRITSIGDDKSIDFRINYEGSWSVIDSHHKKEPILIDCNTSGGSQLLEIIHGLKEISENVPNSGISQPKEAYILFRADVQEAERRENIDDEFETNGCQLYRFFDLDEDVKKKIYELKESVGKGNYPSLFNENDKKRIDEIINCIKAKNHFYYKQDKDNGPYNSQDLERQTTQGEDPSLNIVPFENSKQLEQTADITQNNEAQRGTKT